MRGSELTFFICYAMLGVAHMALTASVCVFILRGETAPFLKWVGWSLLTGILVIYSGFVICGLSIRAHNPSTVVRTTRAEETATWFWLMTFLIGALAVFALFTVTWFAAVAAVIASALGQSLATAILIWAIEKKQDPPEPPERAKVRALAGLPVNVDGTVGQPT